MEKVCPICNSLQKIEEQCPICLNILKDGGMITDYLGPYSPYVENSVSENVCMHLLYCTQGHYDTIKTFEYTLM